MATQPIESRVSTLEQAMIELAQAQARTQAQMDRSQAQMDQIFARTEAQMDQRSTRTEAQMEQRSARIDAQLDRTQAANELLRVDLRALAARQDRQWGELANRWGTLTEDIVLPGIPAVFHTLFGEERRVEMAIRVWKNDSTDPGRSEEYDAVASNGDVVLIAESKSKLRPEHITEFVEKLSRARAFLPEATGKRVVGLLASFMLDPSLIATGERQGLIMVGLGTGLLQMLNAPGFVPRAF